MKPVPKPFPYHTAAETAKPGYLKRRMAKYAEQVKREAEIAAALAAATPTATVHAITPGLCLLRKKHERDRQAVASSG